MSAHNRIRRQWKCQNPKCGWRMLRELGEDTAKRMAESGIDKRLVHLCGVCKTLHYAHGEGLRLLTPAEIFELEVRIPKALRAAKATAAVPGVDCGILTIGNR